MFLYPLASNDTKLDHPNTRSFEFDNNILLSILRLYSIADLLHADVAGKIYVLGTYPNS